MKSAIRPLEPDILGIGSAALQHGQANSFKINILPVNLYLERCNEDWRAAVIDDPNFAIAWACIAFNSGNPQEISEARTRAKDLAPKTTPGEELMISWIVKVEEGDFVGGITAMNDMLAMYPRDKHLYYLAGNWLMGENGNDQARHMMTSTARSCTIAPRSKSIPTS